MKTSKIANGEQTSIGDFGNSQSPRYFASRTSETTEITLSELEQYLWGAANILRGPVDKADFKSYIFPLLFFKRISFIKFSLPWS